MFSVPSVSSLSILERYEVNGRLMAVFAKSVPLFLRESGFIREVYCAALPDCEFTGNQLRKFYKFACKFYGLTKADFYGQYFEHDGCYERIVEDRAVTKRLFNVGSEAYVKAIAGEWEKRL